MQMKILRTYTGADNKSHFEDLTVPFNASRYGFLSELLPAEGLVFRETDVAGNLGYRNPPRRQFVVNLLGIVELECGDGSTRRLYPGDVLLADDTTGQGHILREIESPRRSLFIRVPDDLDISAWRS